MKRQSNSFSGGGGSQQRDKGTGVEKSNKKVINLPSGRKIVIQNGTVKYFAADGKELNKKYFEQKEGKIDVKPSGRYSVTQNGKTKYYAANGTELKENYYKKVENPDVTVKSGNKTYNLNKTIEKRISSVTSKLKKAEDENGFIGKGWSGFKNLTGIGDSSDKVREKQKQEQSLLAQFNINPARRAEIFKQLTGADYTPANLEKFIKDEIKLKSELALAGYKEGQKIAVDVAADVVSGVAAFGIYTAAVAAAPFTGGASIAVGVSAAAGSGALIKTGIKYADAKSGERNYTLKDAGHDAATGAFSGALAPITAGVGGAVGKTITVQAGKAGLKAGLSKAVGFTAELTADGALGGGVDNAFRTAVDGGSLDEVVDAGITGAKYGAVLGPVMGWGTKGFAKGYKGAKSTLFQADDAVPTPKPTRTELKDKVASGNKVTQNNEINIPKGKTRAPSAKFTETDEAFRDIVRLHPDEFRELSKKSGDEFMNSAFKLVKKYMGLEDAPIGFKITDDINYNYIGEDDCYVAISRNWTGSGHAQGKGDSAEIVGAIAHELNHMLQNKEGYINAINKGIDLEVNDRFLLWLLDNEEYFTNHTDYYVKKADSYMKNWKNYIEPDVDYDAYLKQTIEAESHPRGNFVVEEYKKLIGN